MDDYMAIIDELMSFGEELGVPTFFWSTFFDVEEHWDIELFSNYFYQQETGELIKITSETIPSDITNKVRSGANFAAQWSVPFSKEWYICQAVHYFRRCYSGPSEHRLRAGFQFGKAVAEAQWKERTENQLKIASTVSTIRKRAGEGGAGASRARRLRNLETLMEAIEAMANVAGIFSEDRIVAQAIETAQARETNMPKSKKTLDEYGTALRCEEPFKSRYEAVFRKNT